MKNQGTTKAKGETITIRFQSLPGHRAPMMTRLRAFLKAALRRYGLRAVEITAAAERLDAGGTPGGNVQRADSFRAEDG